MYPISPEELEYIEQMKKKVREEMGLRYYLCPLIWIAGIIFLFTIAIV